MLGFDEIRAAGPEDEDKVFALLQELHRENAIFPMSETKVRDMIRHATDRRGGIIAVIDGSDGRLEASFGGTVGSQWYTNAPYLEEVWNFVRGDCRKTKHAERLIEFAKSVADNMGIPLMMGILSTERTEQKLRLYRRHMPLVGGYFLHGLTRPALEDVRGTIKNGASKHLTQHAGIDDKAA